MTRIEQEKRELVDLFINGTEPAECWDLNDVATNLFHIYNMAKNSIEKVKDEFERGWMMNMVSEFKSSKDDIMQVVRNAHLLCELFCEYPKIKRSVDKMVKKCVEEEDAFDLEMVMEVVSMSKKESLKMRLKQDLPLFLYLNYEDQLKGSSLEDDEKKIGKVVDKFVDNYQYDEYGDVEDYDVFDSDLKRELLKAFKIKE